ncbi:MAG: hypothetical protein JST11_27025 [Acidobacteria bacterium]|nr:hypothetical protein [Acidobacteriota bacterium]
MLEYAVKFVCGKSDGKLVAAGEYWTAINLYNPPPKAERFDFRKKFVLAPPSEKPGKPGEWVHFDLPTECATEIDRDDILKHLGVGDFAKGWVVIQSSVPLDVVAVYTAAGSRTGVSTMCVERVTARTI